MGKLRVLELFSGIGGLHWALKETGVPFEVVGALEINPTVLETYALNFPEVNLMRRNIQSLTAEEINKLNIDVLAMSPPCQPFCRTGNKQGLLDNRSSPLNNLLEILPDVKFKYIFLENVKGFETSDAHDLLLEILTMCNFKWQEFLLNPIDLGVPNSRLRYYLIGKSSSLSWSFDLGPGTLMTQLPERADNIENMQWVRERQSLKWKSYNQIESSEKLKSKNSTPPEIIEAKRDSKFQISEILEAPENIGKEYLLSPEKLSKYWKAVDIVTPSSERSCCFTKAYFHYLTGSGSILQIEETSINLKSDDLPEPSSLEGKFRYFTPKEVSRLMCYPEEFKFPENHSPKQCYKALGNSVNVYTVALMFASLF